MPELEAYPIEMGTNTVHGCEKPSTGAILRTRGRFSVDAFAPVDGFPWTLSHPWTVFVIKIVDGFWNPEQEQETLETGTGMQTMN